MAFRIYTIICRKSTVVPFNDHTTHANETHPGYMVLRNYAFIPLPPLFQFVIYFTHTQTHPESVDFKKLYSALSTGQERPHHRFDTYSFPGFTVMDCVAHYQREQIARGSCDAELDAFREYTSRYFSELELPPPPPGRLPGMYTSYLDSPNCDHQAVLFICTEREWRGEEQALSCVQFDSPDLLMMDEDENEGEAEDEVGSSARNEEKQTREEPSNHQTLDRQKKVSDNNSPSISDMITEPWPVNLNSWPAEEETVSRWMVMNACYWAEFARREQVCEEASTKGWVNWC